MSLSIMAVVTMFVAMTFLRCSYFVAMGVLVSLSAMRVTMSSKNQKSCQVGS
jgi:hypothetical protein